ncbi:hypothetical protein EU642_21815 [Salmonella enterica]|nr:hypothetical protein [Salmonella enterica]EAO0118491.1 hypothetical protein [Salmonella enterica]EAO3601711.1 hypothetical protein [Salmonella enterica]EAR6391608.1 hypothetical protein [Salmonella enterica]EAV1285253.1 hypothetical protein [Salmonella enterica]
MTIPAQYIDLYIALTCGWLCIETNLTLKRLESDKTHWLNRALKRTRRYAQGKPMTVSVGSRVFACFGLTLLAWVPVLLASVLWPVTVPIYVMCELTGED